MLESKVNAIRGSAVEPCATTGPVGDVGCRSPGNPNAATAHTTAPTTRNITPPSTAGSLPVSGVTLGRGGVWGYWSVTLRHEHRVSDQAGAGYLVRAQADRF